MRKNNLGKHKKAIECFDEALKINPNFDDARKQKDAAISMYHDNQRPPHYPETTSVVKELPHNDDNTSADPSSTYYMDYDNGLDSFDKDIQLNPKNPTAYHHKGELLFKLAKYNEAIECYDKALVINPSDAQIWYNKGKALHGAAMYNEVKFNEAIRCYDKALELDPNFTDAWYKKGEALYDIRSYTEADRCFDEVLKLDSNNEMAKNRKNAIHLIILNSKSSSNIATVLPAQRMPDRSTMSPANTWYQKGNDFIDTKEFDKAIECFNEALKINPNFDDAKKQRDAVISMHYDNQDPFYNKHQTHETSYVEPAVGSSTRQNISDADNWNNKGISLYNLKKYKEALECYDKAIQLSPNDPIYRDNKGNALDKLGKRMEAKQCHNKAKELKK